MNYQEIYGIDVPAQCSHGHELNEETIRVDECKMTGRRRWRCLACEKEWSRVARERKAFYLRVLTDAVDDELVGRLTTCALAMKMKTSTLLREIVLGTLVECEKKTEPKTRKRKGTKS